MKKHIENYDVFKETISENNVLAMAEQLAMYETRFLIGYMGSRMQKMHADLNPPPYHIFNVGLPFSSRLSKSQTVLSHSPFIIATISATESFFSP